MAFVRAIFAFDDSQAVCIHLNSADSVTITDSVGLFTVNSHLALRLSRADLASTLECRVETPALEGQVVNELSLDLQGNKLFRAGRFGFYNTIANGVAPPTVV